MKIQCTYMICSPNTIWHIFRHWYAFRYHYRYVIAVCPHPSGKSAYWVYHRSLEDTSIYQTKNPFSDIRKRILVEFGIQQMVLMHPHIWPDRRKTGMAYRWQRYRCHIFDLPYLLAQELGPNRHFSVLKQKHFFWVEIGILILEYTC